jgi:hypothetical protein
MLHFVKTRQTHESKHHMQLASFLRANELKFKQKSLIQL